MGDATATLGERCLASTFSVTAPCVIPISYTHCDVASSKKSDTVADKYSDRVLLICLLLYRQNEKFYSELLHIKTALNLSTFCLVIKYAKRETCNREHKTLAIDLSEKLFYVYTRQYIQTTRFKIDFDMMTIKLPSTRTIIFCIGCRKYINTHTHIYIYIYIARFEEKKVL